MIKEIKHLHELEGEKQRLKSRLETLEKKAASDWSELKHQVNPINRIKELFDTFFTGSAAAAAENSRQPKSFFTKIISGIVTTLGKRKTSPGANKTTHTAV